MKLGILMFLVPQKTESGQIYNILNWKRLSHPEVWAAQLLVCRGVTAAS